MKKIFPILFFTLLFLSGKTQQIKQVAELYLKGELEKALILSNELILKDSKSAGVNQIHGRILADSKKYDTAIYYLSKAVEIDNGKTDISGWAYGYLGQCYFMLGQYEKSKDYLSKCIKLNATKNSVAYGKKRMFLFGYDKYFSKWKTIETKNIIFHIQNPKSFENIEYFVETREKAFVEIQNTLGSKLPKKIDFFVWENADEPRKKFNINLGFADPSSVCVYSHRKQTIGHEMTHNISHYIGVNPIKTGLINEGLAIYFNMEKDNKLENLKRAVKENKLENLKVLEFWNNFSNYPDNISYPFSGAFMEELVNRYGIEKLKPLFINQTYENAQKLFGDDINLLINEFEAKIK